MAGCSNEPDIERGIVVHAIPFFDNDDPPAKKRRKQWTDFIDQKRKNFVATKYSGICSAHFTPEDFQRRFYNLEGQDKPCIPRLVRDEIGVAAFPTIQSTAFPEQHTPQGKARRRRRRVSSL